MRRHPATRCNPWRHRARAERRGFDWSSGRGWSRFGCAVRRSSAPRWRSCSPASTSPRDPRNSGVHPFRVAGQRRRGHPSRTPPRRARRGRGGTAGQQPGRHLRQARRRRPGCGNRRRRADRRAGVAGDHRPSHRDPPPHGVRHAAPHHRTDAAARTGTARPRTAATSTAAAPPRAHVVADRTDPVVAVADSGRDRDRAALLPGRAL